jgi:hypothetical protein
MNPAKNTIHIDKFLTNISLMDANESYIEDKIFPTVAVAKQSDKIAVYGRDHLRDADGRRGESDLDYHFVEMKGAEPKRYDIEFYDHAVVLSDIKYAQVDSPFDLRRDATMQLRELEKTAKERKIAALLNDSATYTNTSTPSTLWSATNSTPLADMETAAEIIRAKTGKRPNYAVTNRAVISALKANSAITAKFTGVQVNITDEDIINLLKQHLKLKDVFVGGSIYVNSASGQAETTADVWADDFILYYRPETAGLFTATFGYRFELTAGALQAGGRPRGVTVERHFSNKGDVVQVHYDYQDKVLNDLYSYHLDQVIA